MDRQQYKYTMCVKSKKQNKDDWSLLPLKQLNCKSGIKSRNELHNALSPATPSHTNPEIKYKQTGHKRKKIQQQQKR